MRVLFIHGLESGPLGRKAVTLSNHPSLTVSIPAISPYNPWKSVLLLIRECECFQPDIIVGSSYGAFLAMCLYRLRVWTGPMLLMSAPPSFTIDRPERHYYVHGSLDHIFPPVYANKLVNEDHTLREYSLSEMCKDVIRLGTKEKGVVVPNHSRVKVIVMTSMYILGDLASLASSHLFRLVSKLH